MRSAAGPRPARRVRKAPGVPGALILLALAGSCAGTSAAPAPQGALVIDGRVPPRAFSLAELEQFGARDVEWTHHGETRRYRAVPLEAVLRAAGVVPGDMGRDLDPAQKRAGWKLAVLATASDGFQAAFSVAEVFEGMGPTQAYVALGEGGLALDDAIGPLRLIVPSDGEGSRSVRRLRRLTVVDLRDATP